MAFWNRTQLRGGALHWLLDLTWGGRSYRFSEQGLEADAYGDGDEPWLDGLVIGGAVADSVAPLSDSPEPRAVSIELLFPSGVDVPDLVARGHDLGSATGKLLLWCEGTTEAMTVIDGYVRDPEYGAKDEPVKFSLEELPFEDRALWPPVDATVTTVTWPLSLEDARGEMYPWVFGAPTLDESTDGVYGSPGLIVNTSAQRILIAGHHVEGGNVHVMNYDDGTEKTLSVTNDDDAEGYPVAFVVPSAPLTYSDDGKYYVKWGTDSLSGGLTNPDGSVMRGAGDVLKWWLTRSTLRWDRGRVSAAVPAMNAAKIDCYVMAAPDARITPWTWVRENVLPLLPYSTRMGPGGLYFARYRWDATAVEAVAHITTDNGTAERVGGVSYTPRDEVANEVRMAYRIDAESDKYRKRVVVTGSRDTIETDKSDTVIRNGLCASSHARYGHRVMELSSDVVCDDATAASVCLWRASAHAWQHRLAVYRVGRDFAHLEPGNVVTLTDPEVGLSSAVALVDSVPWGAAETFEIELRILHQRAEWSV